jgi:hypothetical protein
MILPQLPRESRLITYQISDDETEYEAITNAFRAIDVDVYNQDTAVADWAKDCPIETINWDSERPCRVTTIIWDHPIVLTSDEIRIYDNQ